jgi:hypothetical protein
LEVEQVVGMQAINAAVITQLPTIKGA